MRSRFPPIAMLAFMTVLAIALLFEALFLDASILGLDNRIAPPFTHHLEGEAGARPMNVVSMDLNSWITPELLLQRERFQRGEIPLWNERESFGQPLLAQLGFSPFSLAGLFHLVFGPLRAMAVSVAFHLVLLGVGFWMFFRRQGLDASAACLGASAVAFGGFMAVRVHQPSMIHVAAWMPWILLATERLVSRPSFRNASLLGAAVGLSFLSGWPQFSVFSLAAAVVLLAVRLVRSDRRLLTGLLFGFALILGGLISCVQMLPSLDNYSRSLRGGGYSSEVLQAKRFALPSFAGFVLPHAFGPTVQDIQLEAPEVRAPWDFPSFQRWQRVESQNSFEDNIVFAGVIPFALALLSLTRRRRPGEGLPRCLLLASLLMATCTFAAEELMVLLPGFSSGSPKRILLLTVFALAWLAASEFQRLGREGRGGSLLTVGGFLIFLGGVGFLPFEQWLFPEVSESDRLWFRTTLLPDLVRAAAAGAVLILAGRCLARGSPKAAQSLLLLGTVIELLLFGRSVNPPQPLHGQYEPTPVIEWLSEQGAGTDGRMISFDATEVLPASVAQVFGLRSCNGTQPLTRREVGELMQALDPSTIEPTNPIQIRPLHSVDALSSPLLDLAGVRFVTTGAHGHQVLQNAAPAELALAYTNEREGMAVYERSGALPAAFLVPRVRVVSDRKQRIAALVSADFEPLAEALLEVDSPDLAGRTLRSAPVRFTRMSPEKIRVDYPAEGVPSETFLVITEAHDPGWEVTADGVKVPLVRANHAFMGVAVPAGTRRVELTFVSPPFVMGSILSVAGILLAGLSWMFGRRSLAEPTVRQGQRSPT